MKRKTRNKIIKGIAVVVAVAAVAYWGLANYTLAFVPDDFGPKKDYKNHKENQKSIKRHQRAIDSKTKEIEALYTNAAKAGEYEEIPLEGGGLLC